MAGFTKVNLREVEDQAPKFGLSPDLEARFARVPLEAEQTGVTYQRLAPSFRIPWGHTHKTQEEVFIVVSGGLRAKLGDEVVDLGPWDAIRIAKDTMRGFEAGPDGAELIAIGVPGGPGDAEITQGWWSD
ncbi:MAG: cupin domain-containing protein [Actinomycetota bacterium]|nr:cupin domain-containing protein [Actinomycetota bacterium]